MIKKSLLRLLLAVLLCFGSEILFWPMPDRYTPLEWAERLLGYAALSALLLDIIARYRIRSLFGLLGVGGVYGLLVSVLLHPAITLADVPNTLITRVMGAQSLIGVLMLLLLLALLRGQASREFMLAAGITGLSWGVWVRGFPLESGLASEPVSLTLALVYALILLLAIGGAWALVARTGIDSPRLSPVGWLLVLAILGGLLARRWIDATLTFVPLMAVAALFTFVAGMLFFQRRKRSPGVLDDIQTVAKPRLWFGLPALVFLAAGVLGYNLPYGGDISALMLLGALMTAYGSIWLPTISLVLGIRVFTKQIRAQEF